MSTLSPLSGPWLDSLKNNGYRLTAPRRAVVEIIASSARALTPFEVYDAALKENPDLGLVSVYRTLEKLEQLGLIQRVHQPSGCQAFLPTGSGHQHLLLCQNCGRAVLFDGDELSTLFTSVARKTGFKIREHWLQLFGLCADCK